MHYIFFRSWNWDFSFLGEFMSPSDVYPRGSPHRGYTSDFLDQMDPLKGPMDHGRNAATSAKKSNAFSPTNIISPSSPSRHFLDRDQRDHRDCHLGRQPPSKINGYAKQRLVSFIIYNLVS